LLSRFNVVWLKPGKSARLTLLRLYAQVSRQIFGLVLHMQRQAEAFQRKVEGHEKALQSLPNVLQKFLRAISHLDSEKGKSWRIPDPSVLNPKFLSGIRQDISKMTVSAILPLAGEESLSIKEN